MSNNTFTDADAGVRTSSFGAPVTTVAGSAITINGNHFDGVSNIGYQPVGGVLHFTNSTVDGPTVSSEFFGGTTDDTITSTTANDIVHGNDGTDTLVLSGNQNDYTIVFDGTTAVVTDNRLGTHDGVDTADHIGKLHFGDGHNTLLVGTGSDYHTIQDAVAAAASGDAILLSSGTFAGAVDIENKDITILGANHGIDDPANWTHGVTTIDRVAVSNGDLTLDGVAVVATIAGAGFVNGGSWEAIGFAAAPDRNDSLTVKNSTITVDAPQSEGVEQAFGFNISTDADKITIDHVNVTPFTNVDSATRGSYGVYINGYDDVANSNHAVTITNSSFDVGTTLAYSLDFDGQLGSQVTATGNTFGSSHSAPGAIRIYDSSDVLSGDQADYSGIAGNTFTGSSGGNGLLVNNTDLFGAPNDLQGVTVRIGLNSYSDGDFAVLDGSRASSGQTLVGTAANDIITGSGFADTITGDAGNDIFRFEGQFGDDKITDWADDLTGPGTNGENIVFANYAGHTPLIADDGLGNAVITINDGLVDSSVTVQNTAASQLHVLLSGSDFIIH